MKIHEHAKQFANQRVRKRLMIAVVIIFPIIVLIRNTFDSAVAWTHVIRMALGAGISAAFFPYYRVYMREARRYARTLGYQVCVKCGYDLSNLDSRRPCPECGVVNTDAVMKNPVEITLLKK